MMALCTFAFRAARLPLAARAAGVQRRIFRRGPASGAYAFSMRPGAAAISSSGREGVLPSDDPLEGLRQWNIYCRVSRDGGRSFGPVRQIVHEGEFDTGHPLPGAWTIPAQATPIRMLRCCMAAVPGIICSGGCRN
jgi:hypothetical protein